MFESDYLIESGDLIHRILSGLVLCGWAVIAYGEGGVESVMNGIALLVPVACIWFPDEMGAFTGGVGLGSTYRSVDAPSHPGFLRWVSWALLLAVPAYFLFATGE